MPERLSRLSDRELATALVDLGRFVDFPPEPVLAPTVYRRIRDSAIPVRQPGLMERLIPRRPVRRVTVLAFALVVLAATAAVAGLLGVPGLKLIFRPEAVPSIAPSGPSVGRHLALGGRTTLEDASRRASFRPLVAHVAGFPQPEVYFFPQPAGGRISFVYRAGPELPPTRQTGVGLLLTEFLGTRNEQFLEKTIFQGGHVQRVSVDGKPGFWIFGAPHEVVLTDKFGQPVAETLRLAGNTLVWQDGQVTLRLEGRFGKQRALAIARTVR
jgi:hypothetical protein